ncbi:hypothetical protein HD806DRAFT_537833 [Xylariaceae sp. AK1471]|nr:hypothetical protein HD806DRAFT_537833 [Xylariaceae sp. AK1471]
MPRQESLGDAKIITTVQSLRLTFHHVLTITFNDIYYPHGNIQDPCRVLEQASAWLTNIRNQPNDELKAAVVEKELSKALCRAVFGSNAIERVGLGRDVTLDLYRQVFSCEAVAEVDENTSEYKKIVRGHREVIQHAGAIQHMMEATIVRNERFSKELIKKTHTILHDEIPILTEGGEVPSNAYAGK